MNNTAVPTLYEWVGGKDALNRLTVRFYERVHQNVTLAPVFAHVGADHPLHVAAFLAEVLGGPPDYSAQFGGHPHMIQAHLNRHLKQEQRREWVALLLDTADELQMPDDPVQLVDDLHAAGNPGQAYRGDHFATIGAAGNRPDDQARQPDNGGGNQHAFNGGLHHQSANKG